MTAPREELNKNYKNAVFDALMQYQFIECLLKDCINESNRIIKISTKNFLDFEYTEKDLETKALQSLVTLFRRVTTDKNLASEIKKEAVNRNQIAHEACFENWQDLMLGISDTELHKKGCKIQDHADKASEIVGKLIKELNRLKKIADS